MPDNDRTQKQQLNVYSVMLIVAFLAITIACALLYMELREWGTFPWWKTDSGSTATSYIDQVPATPDACPDFVRPKMWS